MTETQTVELTYAPQPRQEIAHRLLHLGVVDAAHPRATLPGELLYGGAAGGGKSYWLVQEMHHRCLWESGRKVVIFRRTFPQLATEIVPLMRRLAAELPQVCDYLESARQIRYQNGSTFSVQYAEAEADVLKVQGAEWDTIGLDEAADWREAEVTYLLSRLRTTNAALRTQLLLTANPMGVGFDWLKARFVAPVLRGQQEADVAWTPEPSVADPYPVPRVYVPSLHSDNAMLGSDYLGNLARITDPLKRAALMTGSWDLPADELALFQPGVLLACQAEATGAQPAQPGHRYLHLWDLARKRDWTVGITLDVTAAPYQIVAYERSRFVPWPQIAERMRVRHAAYKTDTSTSVTRYDQSGVGDPLGQFLDIPMSECEGFVFTSPRKTAAVSSLIFASERAAWRGPATSTDPLCQGIEQLWAELALYRWEDKALVQDSVMALAMAGEELRAAVVRMKAPVAEKPAGYVIPSRPPVQAHGWMR